MPNTDTPFTIFISRLEDITPATRFAAELCLGTVTQAWRWRGGEAVVVCHSIMHNRETVVVLRQGLRKGTPRLHCFDCGIGPLIRALTGRSTRVGVRRGPRPPRDQRANMIAVLRRAIRRSDRRFVIVRARPRRRAPLHLPGGPR